MIISMDTLSSSVSTLKVPVLFPTPKSELYHCKALPASHPLHPHRPHHSHLSSTTKPKKTTASFPQKNLTFPFISSSGSSSPKSVSSNNYRKPSSGYAAALLDKALCHSSLEAVQKDVERLLRLLKNEQIQAILIDPLMADKEKGEIVKEVVNKVKINRYLASVLRMLVQRNKVGMVTEVLEEFGMIYDKLIGTRVVFVSSVNKMEEEELCLIAKKVQKFSGAAKVKIKNLVDQRVPSSVV
ncbi:ATP synthase subunit delta, chloroplastic-like [Mangifera indica]|uniref:ATP synthase subunit delta, chloroplastic-like n=1 Tax=Mangifera indica TaxID=29780 RepID=UPI001CFB5E35|nr:ATP synthase subunit delta, chloroplastic-like [Mangifera indica]